LFRFHIDLSLLLFFFFSILDFKQTSTRIAVNLFNTFLNNHHYLSKIFASNGVIFNDRRLLLLFHLFFDICDVDCLIQRLIIVLYSWYSLRGSIFIHFKFFFFSEILETSILFLWTFFKGLRFICFLSASLNDNWLRFRDNKQLLFSPLVSFFLQQLLLVN